MSGICCSMDHSIPGGFIPPCKILHQMEKGEQPKCTLLVSSAPSSHSSYTQVSLLEPFEQRNHQKKADLFKYWREHIKKKKMRYFSVSHSLAWSLSRINAAAKDSREGKTEGSCHRLGSEADPFSLPLCCFRILG